MYWKSDPALYLPSLRRRVAAGRGIGAGATYQPWKKVREVGSPGTCSIVQGVYSGRRHHFFSELEVTYFYLLERQATTLEIREQWPILDLPRTFELCADLGLPHRQWGKTVQPITIDLLVTRSGPGGVMTAAKSVKSPAEAADASVRRSLLVAQAWCLERGVPWALIDTSRFDKTLLSTLRFIRRWFRAGAQEPHVELAQSFAATYLDLYARNLLLAEQLRRVAREMRTPQAEALALFRYCAWSGAIPIAVRQPIGLNRPVVLRPNT